MSFKEAPIARERWLQFREGFLAGGHHAMGLQEEHEKILPFPVHGHVGADNGADTILDGCDRRLASCDTRPEVVQNPINQRDQDSVLVVEVPVECTLADIGFFGDILNGTSIEAHFIENRECRLQEALVGVGGPPGSSSTLTFWLWIVHLLHYIVTNDRLGARHLDVTEIVYVYYLIPQHLVLIEYHFLCAEA